jgi:hemerythrin superfamily protein
MDVTRILEADHRQVEELFEVIAKADGSEREALIDELTTSLKAHMELEEEVLYPAMEASTGTDAAEEAKAEHRLGRKALKRLQSLAPDEPGFGAAFAAVQAIIFHHVEEEEGDVFPMLRREGKELLAEVATPFMKKRAKLDMPFTADALFASASKDELVSEAAGAGIDRANTMSKAELAEVLATRLAS